MTPAVREHPGVMDQGDSAPWPRPQYPRTVAPTSFVAFLPAPKCPRWSPTLRRPAGQDGRATPFVRWSAWLWQSRCTSFPHGPVPSVSSLSTPRCGRSSAAPPRLTPATASRGSCASTRARWTPASLPSSLPCATNCLNSGSTSPSTGPTFPPTPMVSGSSTTTARSASGSPTLTPRGATGARSAPARAAASTATACTPPWTQGRGFRWRGRRVQPETRRSWPCRGCSTSWPGTASSPPSPSLTAAMEESSRPVDRISR